MCSSFLLINLIKVSLAAQTLSNSVAVALRTLRDMGYAEFKDCEATSELIQVTPKRGWLLKCECHQD